MSTNTKKLSVLRSRTDHDLLILVQRELDRGFALVDVAASRNSPLFAKAVKACESAAAMVPRISGLSREDRFRFEARLRDLRLQLEQVPAYANVRPYLASVAS